MSSTFQLPRVTSQLAHDGVSHAWGEAAGALMTPSGNSAIQISMETPGTAMTFGHFLPSPPILPTIAGSPMNDSDWDDILQCADAFTCDYVSPEVEICLEEYRTFEGSQELELAGKEFVDSPAIPVIGTVPTGFGQFLIPQRMLLPPSQLDNRRVLRERRQEPNVLPTFKPKVHVAKPTQTGACRPRPMNVRRRTNAKSARARLFTSPEPRDQENHPPNSCNRSNGAGSLDEEEQKKALPVSITSSVSTMTASKQPLHRNRRSLDSATPESKTHHFSRAQTARKSKDCSIPGCTKGARSKGLCKRHGGGKRCTHSGCARSDQGGGYCIAHGGGKRCAKSGCRNSAQSRGLCKSHGGGKRCSVENCMKSSQEGGVCRTHGGGKLCKAPVCFNYRHHGGHCRSHGAKAVQLEEQQ